MTVIPVDGITSGKGVDSSVQRCIKKSLPNTYAGNKRPLKFGRLELSTNREGGGGEVVNL